MQAREHQRELGVGCAIGFQTLVVGGDRLRLLEVIPTGPGNDERGIDAAFPRSFGTSSFPRRRQKEGFEKSADVYFGGTRISPTSRCTSAWIACFTFGSWAASALNPWVGGP